MMRQAGLSNFQSCLWDATVIQKKFVDIFVKYIEHSTMKKLRPKYDFIHLWVWRPNRILLSSTVAIIIVPNCCLHIETNIWSSLILPTAANSTERDIYAEARHQLQIDPLCRLFRGCACCRCCRFRTSCCCAEEVRVLKPQVSSWSCHCQIVHLAISWYDLNLCIDMFGWQKCYK